MPVYRAMAAQTRNFHTLEHVFALANPTDPIQSLAALFHDLVYHQVDLGFSVGIQELITPYIAQKMAKFLSRNSQMKKSWIYFCAEDLWFTARRTSVANQWP